MFQTKKTRMIVLSLLCCMMLVLAACGSNNGNTNTGEAAAPSPSSSSPASETPSAKKVKINFYAKDVEWSSTPAMLEEVQSQLKDKVELNAIQVDFANLSKVIKTGIASGTPADIYQYWPQAMKTFVETDQALDLTPYLEANNGEWKKTFKPGLLEIGKYNGKYYNVPISSNFSSLFINTAIFEQAGIAIPEQWTWEQFMAACQTIKEKTGVFPVGVHRILNEWFYRNGLLSLGKGDNKLEDLAAGKVPATDPMFMTPLKNMKDMYDSQYWYPGKGALTSTKEEVLAAFMQGKIAILAEVASDAVKVINDAKAQNINVVAVPWPTMGSENVILGGADGVFIPANAPNKEEAVEVLKAYLGSKSQQIHADAGYATANADVQLQDPSMKSIMEMAASVYPNEFTALSPKITDFVSKEMIPNFILGSMDEKGAVDKLESLRQEAIKP